MSARACERVSEWLGEKTYGVTFADWKPETGNWKLNWEIQWLLEVKK